jgi:hypothetical protein
MHTLKKLYPSRAYILAIGFLFALTGCGSGNVDSFFMVTNTRQGHICVNRLAIAHDTPEGKIAADNLYAYYGYSSGETEIFSGSYVTCSQAKAYGAREPDLIIYADYYKSTIAPKVGK